MHHPPPAVPATGSLPGCFSPAMVAGLIRALPRPSADDGMGLGRQTLHEALATIRLYRPCDVIEAQLVQQIAILHVRAPLAAAQAAANEATPERALRYERHMMAQLRAAGALERRLRLYRREQAAQGYAPATDVPWDYELAALEAQWREAHQPPAAAQYTGSRRGPGAPEARARRRPRDQRAGDGASGEAAGRAGDARRRPARRADPGSGRDDAAGSVRQQATIPGTRALTAAAALRRRRRPGARARGGRRRRGAGPGRPGQGVVRAAGNNPLHQKSSGAAGARAQPRVGGGDGRSPGGRGAINGATTPCTRRAARGHGAGAPRAGGGDGRGVGPGRRCDKSCHNPMHQKSSGAAAARAQPRVGGGDGDRSPGGRCDKSCHDPMHQKRRRRAGGGRRRGPGGGGRASRERSYRRCHNPMHQECRRPGRGRAHRRGRAAADAPVGGDAAIPARTPCTRSAAARTPPRVGGGGRASRGRCCNSCQNPMHQKRRRHGRGRAHRRGRAAADAPAGGDRANPATTPCTRSAADAPWRGPTRGWAAAPGARPGSVRKIATQCHAT